MTLYVAIIGLGTLAGILFNVLFNKRLVFKIIGIAVTLVTGTFACCVVLYPYYFFSSYNNLIIKLSLCAVLLVVIYVSARMIVNAVTSIRKDKAAEAAKAAEKEREEVSVLSHALKSRIKDIITADKAVPAQRVSIVDTRNASGKAPEAVAFGVSAQQPAQTFMQTLKEADDKISESEAFAGESGLAAEQPAMPAAVQAGEAAGTQSDSSKLGILYDQPVQAETTEAKEESKPAEAASMPDVQYEQEETAAVKEQEHDTQGAPAAEVAPVESVKDIGADINEVKETAEQPVEEIIEQGAAQPEAEVIEYTQEAVQAAQPAEEAAEQPEAQPEAEAVSETEEAVVEPQQGIEAAVIQEAVNEANVEAPETADIDAVQAEPVSGPVIETEQSIAVPDKYAAIIAKAGELMEQEKYAYAAELLQMCADRAEDAVLKKRADIMIIECLALSHQNSEAQKRWFEFLNKAYALDEADKIKLKKVMSSL